MASDSEVLEAVRRALGVTPTVSAVTVGQLYHRFRVQHRTDYSWRVARSLLRPFVVRWWRAPAASLTPEAWADHRAARRMRNGKPPKDSTLNMELVRAKQLLSYGVALKLLASNPLAACKGKKTREHRETWLTWAQTLELVRGAGYLRWTHQRWIMRAWILVAVTTGMRGAEIRRLRWDRIGDDGLLTLGSASTKSRRKRVVALPSVALAALHRLEHGDSQYVFVNLHRDGKLLNLTTIRRWFRQCAEAVGLDTAVADGDVRLRPHDLRHSAASIADARGAQATAIRDLLGHSNLHVTERYLHRKQVEGALHMATLMEGPRYGPRRAVHQSSRSPLREVDGEIPTRVQTIS